MTRSKPKPIDPLSGMPGYALRRASVATMAKLAQSLAVLGLRPTDATVLLVIEANPGITQSEIGRMLAIARANMVPLVTRLAQRGLTVRLPVDGRSHGFRLSGKGRALAARTFRRIKAHESILWSHIPESLRDAFMDTLRALRMK